MNATDRRHSPAVGRCARCARPIRTRGTGPIPGSIAVARQWPDGPVCSGCVAKAVETFGVCDCCGIDRMLPGRGPDGQRWCTECAGGLGDFTCTRCGREGWIEQRGVCGWCVLHGHVSELLDDGTGRIRPELQPLADLICSMDRPRSGIRWLTRPEPQGILRALAHGQVQLTHEGVHTLPPVKSSIYVRDLMVACGILAPVDRFLFLFEQWWPEWLATIEDDEHRKTLRHFITWHILRPLRQAAAHGPLRYTAPERGRRNLRKAAWFLHHLTIRGRTLHDCTQADIDHVYATENHSLREDLRPFLRWAMNTRRMPKLHIPSAKEQPTTLITQQQRIDLIGRIHTGEQIELADRVLALLVLVYAQPLARIQQLTIDDIQSTDDGQLLIRLGDPPAPVPPPFDRIVQQHINERANQMTATNADSRWLFPGRRAGQPLHITSMRLRLSNLGIPNLSNRSRAIRELLRQAPPIIVAGMLGYSATSAEKIATEYGSTWQRYPQTATSQPRRPPSLSQ